jgi:DNA-binding Lrp family transcriptional regulator
MKHNVDQVDIAILKVLQQDYTHSNKQIAGIVNKSEATVSNRIKWLMANGFVLSIGARLNPDKLGNKTRGRMHLKFDEHSDEGLQAFKMALFNIKGVTDCDRISGVCNFIVTITTTDSQSFAEIVGKIAAIYGVLHYDLTYLLLDSIIPDRGFEISSGT